MPKAIPAPVMEGEALVYSTDAPDPAIFAKLPNWMQEKIQNRIVDAPKAAPKAAAALASDFVDDDLAF